MRFQLFSLRFLSASSGVSAPEDLPRLLFGFRDDAGLLVLRPLRPLDLRFRTLEEGAVSPSVCRGRGRVEGAMDATT